MARKSTDSGGSIRLRKGKASIGFAGVVMAGLLAGAGYLHVTGQWGVIAGATEMQYREWFEALVNDPDNEEYRAKLIQHVVEHYRETPAGKSLPLRDEQGRVVGRFRIHEAKIEQPYADSDEPAQRRVYTVALNGGGELWHETGGRVRFTGKAFVTYQVDFRVQEWAAYAYFTCLSIEREWFECLHIDNIWGNVFKSLVRNAGKRSLVECLEPGFTIIARPNGDTWLAFGHVGKEFQPRKGPFEESDRDCECECNDASLLHAGYRDYLGPIELFDGNELRVTIETEPLDPSRSFGVDVLLLSEEEFLRYEQSYPRKLRDMQPLQSLEQRVNMQKLNHTFTGLTGKVYLLVDNTGLSGQRRPSDGLVKYYVRTKR